MMPCFLIMPTLLMPAGYEVKLTEPGTLSQRNERIRNITGGYDFRGNASLFDIILCYLMFFFGLLFLVSLSVFFLLTKVFGFDL